MDKNSSFKHKIQESSSWINIKDLSKKYNNQVNE